MPQHRFTKGRQRQTESEAALTTNLNSASFCDVHGYRQSVTSTVQADLALLAHDAKAV
jgi:very-short-patch-repair endonuclease